MRHTAQPLTAGDWHGFPVLFERALQRTCGPSCRASSSVPSVNDEYGDVDSVLYMLTGEGADYAQLKTVAEGLRQRLLKVTSAVKVNLYGVQDEKIFVEFSHAKLATLGIPPQALFDSL